MKIGTFIIVKSRASVTVPGSVIVIGPEIQDTVIGIFEPVEACFQSFHIRSAAVVYQIASEDDRIEIIIVEIVYDHRPELPAVYTVGCNGQSLVSVTYRFE